MFNEITKKGVLAALENPTEINKQMVDAQQARRVLDRLVGYKISPLLWDKVRRGLSAGRVQSVALKLVCDREREIEASSPRSTGTSRARLSGPAAAGVRGQAPEARRQQHQDRQRGRGRHRRSPTWSKSQWTVNSVTTKERKKGAVPPFITSKLQQAARFPVKKTMLIAQQLYEGIELPGEGAVGLITYMRTDSTRVSEQALTEVREFIGQQFGADYVPEKPNIYKAKKDAQDAHEAIRPTSMECHPDAVREHLTPDRSYLYQLIWNRFVASQMPPAVFDETTVDIDVAAGRRRICSGSRARCRSSPAGSRSTTRSSPKPDATAPVRTPCRADDEDGAQRPAAAGAKATARAEGAEARAEVHAAAAALQRGDARQGARGERHRPADTYASIIGVIQAREYMDKIEGRFKPTCSAAWSSRSC